VVQFYYFLPYPVWHTVFYTLQGRKADLKNLACLHWLGLLNS